MPGDCRPIVVARDPEAEALLTPEQWDKLLFDRSRWDWSRFLRMYYCSQQYSLLSKWKETTVCPVINLWCRIICSVMCTEQQTGTARILGFGVLQPLNTAGSEADYYRRIMLLINLLVRELLPRSHLMSADPACADACLSWPELRTLSDFEYFIRRLERLNWLPYVFRTSENRGIYAATTLKPVLFLSALHRILETCTVDTWCTPEPGDSLGNSTGIVVPRFTMATLLGWSTVLRPTLIKLLAIGNAGGPRTPPRGDIAGFRERFKQWKANRADLLDD